MRANANANAMSMEVTRRRRGGVRGVACAGTRRGSDVEAGRDGRRGAGAGRQRGCRCSRGRGTLDGGVEAKRDGQGGTRSGTSVPRLTRGRSGEAGRNGHGDVDAQGRSAGAQGGR